MIRGSGPPAARLLSDLAALGPYFAVEVHGPGSPLARPWQPLGELISSPSGCHGRASGEPGPWTSTAK